MKDKVNFNDCGCYKNGYCVMQNCQCMLELCKEETDGQDN